MFSPKTQAYFIMQIYSLAYFFTPNKLLLYYYKGTFI